jgi:gliding motility-associated-like protein
MTISGGWGNFTCNWPDPLPDQHDLSGVSSGSYTVTVTDGGGCTASQTVVVPGPQNAISIGSPVVSNVTCAGQGNGGVCVTLTGGNGAPYQVAWSNTSLTGACIGMLPGGSYAPTVSDAMGCTAVFSAVTITEPTVMSVTGTVTTANPTGGIDISVSGGTPNGGASPYTYSWSGPNSFTAVTEDISTVPAGTYTVVVTDANACSMTRVFEIQSANVLLPVSISSVINACGNDGCINISLPPTASAGAPFVLSWQGGSLPPTSSLNPSACGLAAGLYTITITASNGNTATVTQFVNQNAIASVTASTVVSTYDDLSNGSITIQTTSNVLWSNGSTGLSLTGLDAGNYSLTVTNPTSGCTAVYSYTVNQEYYPYLFNVVGEIDPTCANSFNGAIVVTVQGGNGPNYLYQWSGPNGFTGSTKNISGLAPGNYFLTVTDESGTTYTHGPITLTPQSALAITNVNETSTTPGGTQVSGANVCDGAASVVFSGQVGATSILWSNGVTTADNTTLCGGAYSVSVTDGQGCVSIWHDALTAPQAIAATNQVQSPTCGDKPTGSARVYVSGGIAPYDVEWSNGQGDQNVFANGFSEAISLSAGTYTVTITDGNGITQVHSVEVPGPQPLEVTYTGIEPHNYTSCDGERIAFVTNAAEPVTYEWIGIEYNAAGTEQRIENLCAGETLILTIEDANGCILRDTIELPFPEDGCYLVRPVLTPAEQDGNNDFTQINCIEENPNNNMEIYNRWGQLVFQTAAYVNDPTDPTHCWTGVTRTGQPLPEGVYYYVLTINVGLNNQTQFKGHINLLK